MNEYPTSKFLSFIATPSSAIKAGDPRSSRHQGTLALARVLQSLDCTLRATKNTSDAHPLRRRAGGDALATRRLRLRLMNNVRTTNEQS